MSSQNDLIQGLDLAGETQVSGADLEQLVREAKPNSHIAFNLFGTASPDVTSNSRYARYIRYTAAGAWPQYYDSGTLTWTNIPLASGAVTTSKIADGSVTLEKFDTTALPSITNAPDAVDTIHGDSHLIVRTSPPCSTTLSCRSFHRSSGTPDPDGLHMRKRPE